MSNVKTKKSNREQLVELTLTAVLAALILLMTFCGIGYIPINPVLKLTLHTLPVAIGSIVLGERAGLILGGVFGISSFITCFGMDPLGVALLGINPILTAVMCIVPRILCGVMPALIMRWVGKDKLVSIPLAAVSTPVINTVFFLSFMWIFFGKHLTDIAGVTIDSIVTLFILFAGVNALIEVALCLVVGSAIAKVLLKVKSKFIM